MKVVSGGIICMPCHPAPCGSVQRINQTLMTHDKNIWRAPRRQQGFVLGTGIDRLQRAPVLRGAVEIRQPARQ